MGSIFAILGIVLRSTWMVKTSKLFTFDSLHLDPLNSVEAEFVFFTSYFCILA